MSAADWRLARAQAAGCSWPSSASPRGCRGSASARRSELQLRAVKAGSHSNDGFGSDSGPSRGEPRRPAFRPSEAFPAALTDGRPRPWATFLVGLPYGRNAQLAAARRSEIRKWTRSRASADRAEGWTRASEPILIPVTTGFNRQTRHQLSRRRL